MHFEQWRLGMPGTAALADVRQMIEGSLEEQGHVPRNVQVVLIYTEGSLQIKLLNVEGTFLETELCESEEVDKAVLTTHSLEGKLKVLMRTILTTYV